MKPCCVLSLWENISIKLEHVSISKRKKNHFLINDLPSTVTLTTELLKLPTEFFAHRKRPVTPAYEQGELEQWSSWTERPSARPCYCCVWSDLASNTR